jgi:hypothetical protein
MLGLLAFAFAFVCCLGLLSVALLAWPLLVCWLAL